MENIRKVICLCLRHVSRFRPSVCVRDVNLAGSEFANSSSGDLLADSEIVSKMKMYGNKPSWSSLR